MIIFDGSFILTDDDQLIAIIDTHSNKSLSSFVGLSAVKHSLLELEKTPFWYMII